MASLSLLTLKRGLLLLWAAWFSIVCLTNLLDALKAIGVLPTSWAFASSNWNFMLVTTAMYATPHWLVAILFAGVIVWELFAAIVFWRALGTSQRSGGIEPRTVTTAFVVGLALMAGFVLTDEIFIAYEVESTHLRLFIAQLVSLLAILLLPDHPDSAVPVERAR